MESKRNRGPGLRGKWVIGICLTAGITTAAMAAVDFSQSNYVDNYRNIDPADADITQSGADGREFLFKIPNTYRARAEIRRESQDSGSQSMGGNFRLNNQSGNYLSIIQVLNVKQCCSDTGPSEPVSQLAIRKNGTKKVNGETLATYEFYIEQVSGKPRCGNIAKITKNQTVSVKVTYSKGSHPTYYVGGRSCTGGKSDRKVGYPSTSTQATQYYGKLGVYKTNDGTGSSSVSWKQVYD